MNVVLTAEALRYEAAAKAYHEAGRTWVQSLPDFPADGVCPSCGQTGVEHGLWQHNEPGYFRWTNGQVDDGVLTLSTDGWDDMSEHGSFEWVECNEFNGGCGSAYKLPENVEWE
jgi:hypothetical protein